MPYSWDDENKQILSRLCLNCNDSHFASLFKDQENVGCCRYEPVFTLFEIYKMVKDGQEKYFSEEIYHHPHNTIFEYEIIVHANVDPRFQLPEAQEKYERLNNNPSTKYQAVDFKLNFSVCSFFVSGQGCGLNPRYKTSICRSLVCHTIEDQATPSLKKEIQNRQRIIMEESNFFNRTHKKELQKQSINLVQNPDEVVQYLKQLS